MASHIASKGEAISKLASGVEALVHELQYGLPSWAEVPLPGSASVGAH
jgi:hypothetical protein